MRLQQAAGNRATAGLLGHGAVIQRQAKKGRSGTRRSETSDAPPGTEETCKRDSEKEPGKGPAAAGRLRVRICVNSNELFVEELAPPRKRVFHSLVATGGEGTPTPTGTFKLGPWERDYTTPRWGWQSCTPWSKRPGFNVFGPYIARFHNGYFLHGTFFPSVMSAPWINVGALVGGSHGCVRMNNVDLVRLHDDILSNPAGTQVVIENCSGPAEATSETRISVPFATLGEGAGPSAVELQYRRFGPTLLGNRLQPFGGATLGTEGAGLQLGTTIEPLAELPLYLEGRAALRTEWFRRVEVGAGAEVGLALTKARSVRLGVSWEVWQTLGDEDRRNVISAALGLRF